MLTESMEDYLETLFRLTQEKGYIKAVDLAETLKVQPSSVTRMLQKLHREGFIQYHKYRHIELTEKGKRLGYFLLWRHRILKEFLALLGAQKGVEEQVEGIEHYITPATMGLIRNLVLYLQAKPQARDSIQKMGDQASYPQGEDLKELRAWLFRHSSRPQGCYPEA